MYEDTMSTKLVCRAMTTSCTATPTARRPPGATGYVSGTTCCCAQPKLRAPSHTSPTCLTPSLKAARTTGWTSQACCICPTLKVISCCRWLLPPATPDDVSLHKKDVQEASSAVAMMMDVANSPLGACSLVAHVPISTNLSAHVPFSTCTY